MTRRYIYIYILRSVIDFCAFWIATVRIRLFVRIGVQLGFEEMRSDYADTKSCKKMWTRFPYSPIVRREFIRLAIVWKLSKRFETCQYFWKIGLINLNTWSHRLRCRDVVGGTDKNILEVREKSLMVQIIDSCVWQIFHEISTWYRFSLVRSTVKL